MGNVLNILHGPCQVLINGVDIGYTQGGCTLRKSVEFLDVEADQIVGVAAKKVTMEKMFVSTTMLEGTLVNMMRAFSEPASNTAGSGDLEYGCAAPEAQEYLLTLVGSGPSSTDRTYTFYRAVVSEDVELSFGARDAVTAIPVTWELLKDANHNNKFGYHADA